MVVGQRNRTRVASEDQEQGVLDHQGYSQGNEQLVLQGLPHGAGKHPSLDHEPNPEHDRDADRQG